MCRAPRRPGTGGPGYSSRSRASTIRPPATSCWCCRGVLRSSISFGRSSLRYSNRCWSGPAMAKHVLVLTRDLMFRGKLRGVVEAAGAAVTRDARQADIVVVELETDGWEERVREA